MTQSLFLKKDMIKTQSKCITKSGRDKNAYIQGGEKDKDEAKKKMIQH